MPSIDNKSATVHTTDTGAVGTLDPSRQITITLAPSQVETVLRAVTGQAAPILKDLVARLRMSALAGGPPPGDKRDLSQSLIRGLSVLTCLPPDGQSRGVVEIAQATEMSPSTAHRYATTLVALGLLEQSPITRKYGLPRA